MQNHPWETREHQDSIENFQGVISSRQFASQIL